MAHDPHTPSSAPRSTLVTRNVTVSGHRTSMRLEPEMWNALEEIAYRERRTVHELCSLVDERRHASSLTAATRVFILGYFRAAVTEDGHATAGHGAVPETESDSEFPFRRHTAASA